MMKHIGTWLKPLIGTAQAKQHPEQAQQDFWDNTGDVYYLLETAKLSYRTALGLITVEHLPLNEGAQALNTLLTKIFADLKQFEAQQVKQQPVCLQVCAMTWERLGAAKRVRGISNAAKMRFFRADQRGADVHFHHEVQGELLDLSVQQFLDYLQQHNQRVLAKYQQTTLLRASNFQSLFSHSEQRSIHYYSELLLRSL